MPLKTPLIGMDTAQLRAVAEEAGMRPFAGGQIARWLYSNKVRSIDDMTNLPKDGRSRLSQRYQAGPVAPLRVARSADGTVKYLFCVAPDGCLAGPGETSDGVFVESVVIPDGQRRTLCVSSQAGCRMGCRFCATGAGGFKRNLSVAGILAQFLSIDNPEELTNAVFMGMGEPFDNTDAVLAAIDVLTAGWGFAWSPKRITVSTAGVIPGLKRFLDASLCHLAVSLHSPFAEQRAELMPVQKAYGILDVLDLIRRYDFTGQRRVSFEYTMFAGVNDTKRHADGLVSLLRGLECRVNLIRCNAVPGLPFAPPADVVMEMFRKRLNAGGITATIRISKGEDIDAACGMLAGKEGGVC